MLLRPVLAEVIEVERTDRRKAPKISLSSAGTSAPTVIDKWRNMGDENMQRLARSLRVAFHLFRWRWVIVLIAVLGGVLWYDLREWQWSHADPLPVVDTLQIRQQRMLPLRLVWQRWVPVFQRYEADRQAALEKALLKAAEKQSDEDLSVASQNSPGPVGRTRRTAEQVLTRISKTQKDRFSEQLLEEYREERARAYEEEEAAKKEKKDPRLAATELLAFLRELPSIGMRAPKPTAAEEKAAKDVLARRQLTPSWPTEQESILQQGMPLEMPQQEDAAGLTLTLPGGSATLPPEALDAAGQAFKHKQGPVPRPSAPPQIQPPPPPSGPSWRDKIPWLHRKKAPPPPGEKHGNG
jgi:hypothetical protein